MPVDDNAMATCVMCRRRFAGIDPAPCSSRCRSQADRELAGLVRSQRRLQLELTRPDRLWQHWLPSHRSDRAARESRLHRLRERAALLTASKLSGGQRLT